MSIQFSETVRIDTDSAYGNDVSHVSNCSSNTRDSVKMPWLCMLCKMCNVRVCMGLVVIVAVSVGGGGGSPQVVQVKQEPALPGNVVTPKAPSTIIKRGKGRGQKASAVSIIEMTPEGNEYFVEVREEDLEGSDSDPTELYAILAEITGPEEEIKEELESEIEPPI